LSASVRPLTARASPWSSGSNSLRTTGGRRRRRSPPSGTSRRLAVDEERCRARQRVEACERQRDAGTPSEGDQVTIALVEPPIAMSPRIALSKAFAVRISEGRGPPRSAISTPGVPSARPAPGAGVGRGIAALPGSVMPRASAIEAIVDAVPMTMQWPVERERHASTSQSSSSVSRSARRSAHRRRTSVPEPSSSVRHLPRSIGPPVTMMAGRRRRRRP